jgi:predicted RNA-binding protein with PIN domain
MSDTNDVPLTLDNVAKGRIAARFAESLATAREFIEENVASLVKAEATITITIDLAAQVFGDGSDKEIGGWSVIGRDVKLKLPERMGRAQKARVRGGQFVVDEQELDEHGTRNLFAIRGGGE